MQLTSLHTNWSKGRINTACGYSFSDIQGKPVNLWAM